MKTSFIPDFWNQCTLAKKGAGAVRGLDWEDWSNSHPWSLNFLPSLLLPPFPTLSWHGKCWPLGWKDCRVTEVSVRMGDGGPQSAGEEAVEKHIRLDLSWFCTSRLFCPLTISREGHTLQSNMVCYPRPMLHQGPLGHCGPTLSQYWHMYTQGDAYENFSDMVLMTRSRKKKI